ncbi:MAG: acyltransferase [Spirosomaceae bacterium]|jgi:peptidoglycan/LPS O-acetylase OafA/YrhL|nr:acyltransferase [Spirosomataceae bacterium]
MHRIDTLDSFRGLAALLVVLFHLTLHQSDAIWHFSWGCTGVDLFFMISGFVILMTLYRTKSPKDFVFARFSRLYPVYWVAVTITALAMLVGQYGGYSQISWWEYFTNLSMFQQYFEVRDLDGSYWTLLVEMLFYAAMLALLTTHQLKHTSKFGLGVVLLQLLIHGLVSQYWPQVYATICKGFPLINHFQLFWAGILFYRIYTQGHSWQRYLGLVLAYGVTIFLFDKIGKSNLFVSFEEYIFIVAFYFVLFYLFVQKRLEWLNNRATLFLGSISYSLYIIHHYLMVGIITIIKDKFGWSFGVASLLALATAFGIAILMTYWIEKPALMYLRKQYKSQ